MTATILISILYKLGKGIVLMESIAFMYTFTCLLMPVMGYKVYNKNNYLAKIFIKYMMVSEDVYFGYCLPAVIAFIFAITLPFRNRLISDSGEPLMKNMGRIRSIINQNTKPAVAIILIGFIMLVLSPVMPGELRFFTELFYFASFAGILYIFYSGSKKLKFILIPLFLVVLLFTSLDSRMFTVVVYMGLTIYSFFFIGSKASFLKKLSLFVAALFFVLILQNAKSIYRTYLAKSTFSGNKAQLFAEITYDQLTRGDALIERNSFFPVFTRMNQGWNISLVLRRIPSQQDFDNGKELAKVTLAAIVPRFLWPDKPEAGGKFNMKHYAGLTIVGWSTNVGPIGEAYGSFGVAAGIIFMFFLGLFTRFFYVKMFRYAVNTPLLILWLPVLFYKITYSAETDTLQIMNSLFKTAFFIWLVYKFLPGWFGKYSENKTGYPRNSKSVPRHSLPA